MHRFRRPFASQRTDQSTGFERSTDPVIERSLLNWCQQENEEVYRIGLSGGRLTLGSQSRKSGMIQELRRRSCCEEEQVHR
ncbi:hypothetical protein Bxe_C0363 [Paraburkholderia xenovorans LB400]|uniref:Uncharacterized protein n=1 Tax=Paraburkholderia xenovorans (strain LB400) TaxID=266265 RepID=Q13I19_PARXL|nr:hypothetical protein Bxe_C0363 [Paraburkholderia xenovorans LB400]